MWEMPWWSIAQFCPFWPLGHGQETAWEDMGKRVWELVYRNAYVLQGVGYDGESEHRWGLAQVAKLLHLTFQHSIAIQWWVAGPMEKSKPLLAFAGSCKLRCYVSSHLTTCSAAQSLLTSCSQHFVEERRYISMCCGSRNCLWGRAVGLRTWKMLCTNNRRFLTGKAVQFWTPKGLEKTELYIRWHVLRQSG